MVVGIPISPLLNGRRMTLSHNGNSATAEKYGVAASTQDLTIEVLRSPLEIGPEMITFKVVDWAGWDTPDPASDIAFDRRRVDIDFYWNFDDPGSSFRTNLNVHADWKNANVAHGPEVSHTFDPTGTGAKTYSVTVWAVEPKSGKTLEKTISLTVKDPLVAFTGDDIIYVDDEGTFANAPVDTRRATTLQAAYDIADGSPTPTWIMLRQGRNFPTTGNRMRSSAGAPRWANFYLSTEPGYTSRATIEWLASGRPFMWEAGYDMMTGWTDKKAIQFIGIDISGPWDSLTETGDTGSRPVGWNASSAISGDLYVMWHDCKFSGMYVAVDMNGEHFIGLSNCDITNWRDYGVFGVYRNFSVIGTHIARDVNALAGGSKNSLHNRHGCIRTTNPSSGTISASQIIDACYLYNHAGWFTNSGRQTPQPPIRFNQGGVEGARLNLQRTTIIGGFHCIELDRTNSGETPRPQNVLMDRLHLVPFTATRYAIECQYGGVVGRNITMVKDEAELLTGTHSFRALAGTDRTQAADKDAHNSAAPVEFTNCTIVGLRDRAEQIIHSSMDDRPALVSENHIQHYPNASPPVTSFAPLDDSGNDITNGYPGYQDASTPLEPQYAISGPFGATYAPQPGSSAVGAALGSNIPYRDASGKIRKQAADLGAWES